MRTYINSTEGAIAAVEQIVALVKSGQVDPLIGLDIETSPLRSLVGYPNTLIGGDGEPVEPNKKLYLSYAQTAWRNNYNPEKLAQLGVYVPSKLTTGNEAKGVPARAAWQALLARAEELGPQALEKARWAGSELEARRAAVAAEVARLQQDVARLVPQVEAKEALPKNHKERKGIAELKKALKLAQGELLVAQTQAELLAGIDLAHPIDGRLLIHVLKAGVKGLFKKDPIKPGLDPHTSEIFLVQFTLRRKDDGSYLSWIFNSRIYDLKLLLPALRLSRQARYIGANIKFDLAHLLLALGEAPQNVWCTRVASRMLYLGLKMPHSLAACAKRFAGIEMSKEERNLFVGRWYYEPTPEMLRYAFTDTEVLFPVYDAQLARAEEQGQADLIDVYSRYSYPVAVRELLGMCIDAEKWTAIAEEQTARRDKVAEELEQLLLPPEYRELFAAAAAGTEEGEDEEEEAASEDDDESVRDTRRNAIIRISQRDLVIERLRELLGEKFLTEVFPDGKVSLGKDARELMETVYIKMYGAPHPFFGLYKKWAKLAKQVNTYGKGFLFNVHPLTGRVHSRFGIAGTDTGRDTSTEPNLLNIPRGDDEADFRAAFVAPEGYQFGDADYSGMEQRIAGDLTGDPVLIALYEAGGDGHSVSAAMMYHVRQGTVSEPQVSTEAWQEGSAKDTITKVVLPASWTPFQVVEFIVKDKRFTMTNKKGETVACSLMELIEVVHKKTTRQSAKEVGLGKQFGMTKFGIARKKNIPLAVAEEIENLYDGVYAVMKAGQDKAAQLPFENCIEGNDGERYGYGQAYNGLRRWFKLPHNPSRWEYPAGWAGEAQFREAQHQFKKERMAIEREAKNVGTQGGNAVVTTEAQLLMVELGKAYRPDEADPRTLEGRLRLGIFPLLGIYDEILTLVPVGIEEREANKVIEQAMLEPSRKYLKRVPSKADANPLAGYWKKY